jgi:phytoene dehydrogenase-like protein
VEQKSILIIGAGIAGLAAGCYACLNGYAVTVVEMHDLPGGLCTAWNRRGYTFDGCIHYLFGSGDGQPFNAMWRTLGAVQDRPMIDHQEYQRITDGDNTLIVYTDPDELEAHLCHLSPADRGPIHDLCDGIRAFTRFDMFALYEKPRGLMTANDWRQFGQAMTPFLMPMWRWATVSAADFARRFKHPFLKRAMAEMFSWPEAPVMMGMFLLAYAHNGNAGFPAGGSLAFSQAIARRLNALGGRILYRSHVERILVHDRRAVGVRLYSDEELRADVVIAACDGRATIFTLLDGAYTDRATRRRYDGRLPMHAQVQVSLGVKRDLHRDPHWVTHLLREPVLLAGEPHVTVGVKHYGFDPSLAPTGCTPLEIMIRSDYDYWQPLAGRRSYDTEQRQVSELVIHQLDRFAPGLAADIEVVDEATPLSYEHFTGNWRGSTCGFLLTRETMPMLINGLPKTLPGLRNFYMAGQWVEPGGGVPMAAASGRNAIQMMCHAHGRPFIEPA